MDTRQVHSKTPPPDSQKKSPSAEGSSKFSHQSSTVSAVKSSPSPAGQRGGRTSWRQKTAFLWRPCAYTAAFLVSLLVISFLAVFTFVKVYPEEISHKISQELQKHTGMELKFSGIDMALLPLPALSFADVHVTHADFSLDVAYATLRPSLLPIFKGNFALGDISLWRPHFVLAAPAQEATSAQEAPSTDAQNASAHDSSNILEAVASKTSLKKDRATATPVAETEKTQEDVPHVGVVVENFLQQLPSLVPAFLYGSSLEILHGSLLLEQENWSLQCQSLNTSVALGALGALDGHVRFDAATFFMKKQVVASAQSFMLTLDGDLDESIFVRVQSKGDVRDVLAQTDIDISLRYTMQDTISSVVSKVLPEGLSQALPQVLPQVLKEHLPTSLLSASPLSTSPDPFSELPTASPMNLAGTNLQGQWHINTHLLWHDRPIAVHSSGSVSGDLQETVYVKDVKVRLEEDSLQLQAALQLKDLENPLVRGHIDVAQLSLTQWFGFARHMPPGLQHTLHRIKGNLDFQIDKKGLTVPRLSAEAAGARFTGKGGVPTWSKAVVFLDIHSPELYLGKVYPEAEGVRPEGLAFAHKPLTPEPGTPEAQALEGEDVVSVDYDIRVAADTVYAWELPIKGFRFRVNPMGLDGEKFAAKHAEAAVLAFTAKDFFDGGAEGKAILYRNAQDESAYDMSAKLRRVRAQRPVERLIGRTLFDGRMSIEATASGKGIYAGEFLVSLGGTASLRVENGNFYSRSKKKVPFKLMTVAATVAGQNDAKVSGAQWPPKLEYAGKWRAALDTEDISAKSTWNGSLEFIDADYGTVALHNIPGSVEVTFAPQLTTLPHSTTVEFDTQLSLNTTKGTVALRKAKGTVPSLAGMQASGFGEMNFSKDIVWTATVNSSTKALSKVLARLDDEGRPLLPPTAPQSATLSMNMAYAKDLLRMEKIQMQVQDMLVTGKMQRTFTSKPAWSFDLAANVFDFDVLFRDKKVSKASASQKVQNAQGAKQTLSAASVTQASSNAATPIKTVTMAKPSASERALSWKWLEDFQAKGIVRIGTYRMNKVQVKNVVAPITISKASLECTPTKAQFYGGDAVINFKGTVKNGALQTQVGVVAKKANLFGLSEDLQLETAIAGSADFWLSAQGPIRYTRDIPAAFDGTWRLQVGQGFLQSRDAQGKLEGNPTHINYFKDAGVITKGVLESHQFELKGDGLSARGRGKVDFVNDTLDMNLVASTGGLNDIPVRFYGDMADPKRDVHTGAVLLSAIGSLGMGVFDLIGGIFGAIFGLFK